MDGPYTMREEYKPKSLKWHALAAAVAVCLALALLAAILVIILAGPRPTTPGARLLVEEERVSIPLKAEQVATPSTYAPTPAPVAATPRPSTISSYSPGIRKRPEDGHRGPSAITLSILATELLLVHDVQRLARRNDTSLAKALSSDPEALALSALFMPPSRVRQLVKAKEKGSSGTEMIPQETHLFGDKDGIIGDLGELLVDGVRLGGNIWKAYSAERRGNKEKSPLQCIWTLYCRNLEKMGSLGGPYGLAGRMNGLGLRLAMKDAGAEDVFAFMARELQVVTLSGVLGGMGLGRRVGGGGHEWVLGGGIELDCPRLFPRCSPMEATSVVMNLALGEQNAFL